MLQNKTFVIDGGVTMDILPGTTPFYSEQTELWKGLLIIFSNGTVNCRRCFIPSTATNCNSVIICGSVLIDAIHSIGRRKVRSPETGTGPYQTTTIWITDTFKLLVEKVEFFRFLWSVQDV
jgi:hypothetical protein